ncbi:hypothetical protein BDV06DRAFT_46396 [Aspergillus oleicola]
MTVTRGHPRRVQSNGDASMQSSGPGERTRGTHGSIGSGLTGNPSWGGNGIWSRTLPVSETSSQDNVSGSGILLASSESDGWNVSRNVPWSSRALSNGITTSPIQSRSHDRSAATLSDSSDSSGYFAQPGPNGMGPSPSIGQRSYLDSGSERISPAGEAGVMGNRSVYKSGDRRNVYAGTPAATAYQTQSGFTSPLESTRTEQMGSLSSMPQTMTDTMRTRNYAHSSHNSASFAPQRPSHFSPFHSESQFSGRYGGNDATALSAELERIQLNEAHSAATRPAYVSHASMDSALSRMRNQAASDEDSYQAVPDYTSDGFSQNQATAYQTGNSPQFREQELSAGHYMTFSNARPNGYHTGRRHLTHNASDNQVPRMQMRHTFPQPVDPYQMAPIVNRPQQLSAAYEYGLPYAPALANFHNLPNLNTAVFPSRAPVGRGPNQEEKLGPVLAEFKMSSNKGKKWELKDIFGHIVEFSGDQHGSRFLQTKIETANSDDKEQVFREIKPDCLQLARDIFGNYVIQKMFEHGNQLQKKTMANCMKGQVIGLTKGSYGCRVVQKALEHVLTDQQISIVKELESDVLGCVRCQHGNHVIQKAIEKVPPIYTKRLVEAFRGSVEAQATHMYGCRVVQRMLEHCDDEDRRFILAELHACTPKLIEDQYGNYVIQHVIQHGQEADRSAMIEVVMQKLYSHSKHKFASNVVEKGIEFGNPTQSRAIMRKLTSAESVSQHELYSLMADQYGNYVIQKILDNMEGEERVALVERMRPLMPRLRNNAPDRNCNKQTLAIEKLIGDSPSSNPSSTTVPAQTAVPASTAVSSAPTDAVVSAQNSTTPPHSHKSSPQQVLRSVDDGFMRTPPTPPPSDKQTNGTTVVTSTVQ